MTSGQWAGLLATVGAAFLAQAVVCALLYRQVRRLSRTVALSQPSSADDPNRVAAQVRAIETRLCRVEAGLASSGPASSLPGESKRTRRLDRRQVASADGPVLIAVPSLALPPAGASTTAAAAEELGRRFGGIWTLADSGATHDEIARQTGVPVGQVELILGLRRSKSGVEGSQPTRGATDV